MVERNPEIASIVQDASWLPHRFDPVQDAIHFLNVSRPEHRAATFLTDEYLGEAPAPVVIGRKIALAAIGDRAPIHYIFHSAYCCSTLLARAFDVEGLSMGLKEPLILNDLSGWRSRGAEPAKLAEVLDGALDLLSIPFSPGESVILKPSNLINPFAAAMLAMRPNSRALLLYAPLELFLGSIARKGMWGRLWVRELYVKLARYGLLDYGFSPEEVLRQTDLQIAAIGWLGQHRLFAELATRFPDRVRTFDSETLMARPTEALSQLAALFRLEFDDQTVAGIVAGNAFTHHSKGLGEFGVKARRVEQRDGTIVHADEIEKVTLWAQAVAASAGQPLVLPSSLLD